MQPIHILTHDKPYKSMMHQCGNGCVRVAWFGSEKGCVEGWEGEPFLAEGPDAIGASKVGEAAGCGDAGAREDDNVLGSSDLKCASGGVE